jgi:hypothetical protein
MPVTIRKTDGKYRVSTPSRVHSMGTTKRKAEGQRKLLQAVKHGFVPGKTPGQRKR